LSCGPRFSSAAAGRHHADLLSDEGDTLKESGSPASSDAAITISDANTHVRNVIP
jgi:hypothetical protein